MNKQEEMLLDIFYNSYVWGYEDSHKGLKMKTKIEFKESVNELKRVML